MAKKEKTENRGGARAGAGRPRKEETAVVYIRYRKEVVDKIRARYSSREFSRLGKEWLDSLAEKEHE